MLKPRIQFYQIGYETFLLGTLYNKLHTVIGEREIREMTIPSLNIDISIRFIYATSYVLKPYAIQIHQEPLEQLKKTKKKKRQ